MRDSKVVMISPCRRQSELAIAELRTKDDFSPLADYMEAELSAAKVVEIGGAVVPILLQIPEVGSVTSESGVTKRSNIARRAELADRNVEIEILMPEAALYNREGGVARRAMQRQLEFLKECVASVPRISIGIIPFEAAHTPVSKIVALSFAYDSARRPLAMYEERWDTEGYTQPAFFSSHYDKWRLSYCEKNTLNPIRECVDENSSARIDRALNAV